MGITGLLPFVKKASREVNVREFSGCTVAIDTYCWLHKGAYACADKLVRGEDTDIHIKHCLKYVTMLLSHNIKPILVFDGRHLPAKAMTESRRRDSKEDSKKKAEELLSLGQIDEARSYMRRSIDITHAMALMLIKECRKRNVDCIVAPYEADAQLAYLNINNYAQLVITIDSDLIVFGCTKVLYKMDLNGNGTLVEAAKLPLVMEGPIERYSFDKFRKMCILSGCDYLPSIRGIGLKRARRFVKATQDPDFANALRELPSFFYNLNLTVPDEYRENFLKAEATFKHQFVFDPIGRRMVRLTEPDDEEVEQALCVNAGELLDPEVAFQLALGNLEPFTLEILDNWDPDRRDLTAHTTIKTSSWGETGIAKHPSMWSKSYRQYLNETTPWKKERKQEPIISLLVKEARKKAVTETQDESSSGETSNNMNSTEPPKKKQKIDCDNDTQLSETSTQGEHNIATDSQSTYEMDVSDPITENDCQVEESMVLPELQINNSSPKAASQSSLLKLKWDPNNGASKKSTRRVARSKKTAPLPINQTVLSNFVFKKSLETDTQSSETADSELENSQKDLCSPTTLQSSCDSGFSEDTSQFEESMVLKSSDQMYPVNFPAKAASQSTLDRSKRSPNAKGASKKTMNRAPGLRKIAPMSNSKQTLLCQYDFQKRITLPLD